MYTETRLQKKERITEMPPKRPKYERLNEAMNRGHVIIPPQNTIPPFGGACVDVSGGPSKARACVFRPGAGQHTCKTTQTNSWQCAFSRVVHRMLELVRNDHNHVNVRIVPEHVNYTNVITQIISDILAQLENTESPYTVRVRAIGEQYKTVRFPENYRRSLPHNRRTAVQYNGEMRRMLRDTAYTLHYEGKLNDGTNVLTQLTADNMPVVTMYTTLINAMQSETAKKHLRGTVLRIAELRGVPVPSQKKRSAMDDAQIAGLVAATDQLRAAANPSNPAVDMVLDDGVGGGHRGGPMPPPPMNVPTSPPGRAQPTQPPMPPPQYRKERQQQQSLDDWNHSQQQQGWAPPADDRTFEYDLAQTGHMPAATNALFTDHWRPPPQQQWHEQHQTEQEKKQAEWDSILENYKLTWWWDTQQFQRDRSRQAQYWHETIIRGTHQMWKDASLPEQRDWQIEQQGNVQKLIDRWQDLREKIYADWKLLVQIREQDFSGLSQPVGALTQLWEQILRELEVERNELDDQWKRQTGLWLHWQSTQPESDNNEEYANLVRNWTGWEHAVRMRDTVWNTTYKTDRENYFIFQAMNNQQPNQSPDVATSSGVVAPNNNVGMGRKSPREATRLTAQETTMDKTRQSALAQRKADKAADDKRRRAQQATEARNTESIL